MLHNLPKEKAGHSRLHFRFFSNTKYFHVCSQLYAHNTRRIEYIKRRNRNGKHADTMPQYRYISGCAFSASTVPDAVERYRLSAQALCSPGKTIKATILPTNPYFPVK